MSRYGAATIGPGARIAPTAIIGSRFRPLLDGRQVSADRGTEIGARAWIGEHVVVGEGVSVGADAVLEEFVNVQSGSAIGARALVAGRSWIGLGVTIGEDSVIKGHIGDNSRIGAGCRVAGDLIHRQLDPSIPWDDPAGEEPAPIVEDGAFVGWRAVIVGGVNIGARAYVCAGALITKDVPAGHIARGRNQIMTPRDWRGALGKSPFFRSPPLPRAGERGLRRWRKAG